MRPGPRFHVEHFDDYLADVQSLLDVARAREPGLPVFLLGHSAGGVIASAYTLGHQDELAGLICESYAFQVPAPDAVFGERVCIYVTPRPNQSPTLEDITRHLAGRGVTREWFPEYLVTMDELPRSSGGKVAKAALAEDAKRRWAVEA